MKDAYHIPVLLNKSVEGLNINPSGIYADLTFGGGGHSEEILKRLSSGKLFAFDQDSDVTENVRRLSEKYPDKFIFFKTNFEYFKNFLRYAGFEKIDGIIADLGVSSHQFDNAGRGFSFRFNGIPDMRMNRDASKNSADILNEYDEEKLIYIFKTFGELKSAGKIASAVVKNRKIESIEQLNEIINRTVKTGKKNKILAKIYQALRIETNNETETLKNMLKQTASSLKKGGRLVVLSYHSLEDRIVKNFIRFNDFDGNLTTDIYGHTKRMFKEINKKVIVPDEDEIKSNNRSRSAKLRIAERI